MPLTVNRVDLDDSVCCVKAQARYHHLVHVGEKMMMTIIPENTKGRCHLRFSGIRPLRGYPPLLTENQSEKKKVFFLSGKGGYPPPP